MVIEQPVTYSSINLGKSMGTASKSAQSKPSSNTEWACKKEISEGGHQQTAVKELKGSEAETGEARCFTSSSFMAVAKTKPLLKNPHDISCSFPDSWRKPLWSDEAHLFPF